MNAPIQMIVADQRGMNVQSLVQALEWGYHTPAGRRVRVQIGGGLAVNGLPEWVLRLVDADD